MAQAIAIPRPVRLVPSSVLDLLGLGLGIAFILWERSATRNGRLAMAVGRRGP